MLDESAREEDILNFVTGKNADTEITPEISGNTSYLCIGGGLTPEDTVMDEDGNRDAERSYSRYGDGEVEDLQMVH
jgi:hypothetical protein